MDYPTMGLCLGGIAAVAPFVWRILPQRERKGSLTDHDLERLDAKVNVYQRLSTVENNQGHTNEAIAGLQRDNSLIFGKLDGLKDDLRDLAVAIEAGKK